MVKALLQNMLDSYNKCKLLNIAHLARLFYGDNDVYKNEIQHAYRFYMDRFYPMYKSYVREV